MLAEQDMRQTILTVVAVIALMGCRSNHGQEPLTLDTSFREKAIYSILKHEPIPLPETTPYDRDGGQRKVFNEGFRSGWDCAISGALLYGTFGTPTDLDEEMRKVWSAGWDSGTKAGSDLWLMESRENKGP